MELTLVRRVFTERSTIGELFVDGEAECYTLEDRVRPDGVKVFGETAISAGRYKVIIDASQRFRRLLPRILNVSGFSGIRIHPGNTDKDTHGCVLVGQTKGEDFIGNSRAAFDALFAKLQAATGEIWITITEERGE